MPVKKRYEIGRNAASVVIPPSPPRSSDAASAEDITYKHLDTVVIRQQSNDDVKGLSNGDSASEYNNGYRAPSTHGVERSNLNGDTTNNGAVLNVNHSNYSSSVPHVLNGDDNSRYNGGNAVQLEQNGDVPRHCRDNDVIVSQYRRSHSNDVTNAIVDGVPLPNGGAGAPVPDRGLGSRSWVSSRAAEKERRRRKLRPSLCALIQASIDGIEKKAERSLTSLVRRWTCKNVAFFVLLFSIILCVRSAIESYIAGMLPWIQQTYNFSSTQLSLIAGVEQFGLVAMLIAVAVYGRLAHRPLMMFCGVLVVCLGAIIWSSPYFIAATSSTSPAAPLNVSKPNGTNNQQVQNNTIGFFNSSVTLVPLPQNDGGAPALMDASTSAFELFLTFDNMSAPLYYFEELCATASRGGSNSSTGFYPELPPSVVFGDPCSAPLTNATSSEAYTAYSLICFGGFLIGFGTGLFITSGFMYVEESGQEKNTAMYYGVLLTMAGLGQFLGACVSWWFSSYSVDVSSDSTNLFEWDPRAWWLGMVFLACILFIVCWAFLFFPKYIVEPGWVAAQRQRRLRHLTKVLQWAKQKRRRRRERKKQQRQQERRQRNALLGLQNGTGSSGTCLTELGMTSAGDGMNRLEVRRESNLSSVSSGSVFNPDGSLLSNHSNARGNSHGVSNGTRAGEGHGRKESDSTVMTNLSDFPSASTPVTTGASDNAPNGLTNGLHGRRVSMAGSAGAGSNGSGSFPGSIRGFGGALAGTSGAGLIPEEDDGSDDSVSEDTDTDTASSNFSEAAQYINSNSNSNAPLSSIQEEEPGEEGAAGGDGRHTPVSSAPGGTVSFRGITTRSTRGVTFNEVAAEINGGYEVDVGDIDNIEEGEVEFCRENKVENPHKNRVKKLQSYFKDIETVLFNAVFCVSVISAALAAYLPAGYRSNLSVFAQAQYGQEYQYAWFYTDGLCYSLAQTIGPVIGGVIVHKRKLSLQQLTIMIISLLVINIALFAAIFPIGCTDAGMPWQNNTNTISAINNPPPASCFARCSCSAVGTLDSQGNPTSAIQFDPVCSQDGVRYYSPCHAGCQRLQVLNSSLVYSDCSCATEVSALFCTMRCPIYGAFWLVLFLAVIAHSIGEVCVLLLFLRLVTEELRNLSLGLGVWVVVLAAYVPGTAVFSAIASSSCSISQPNCFLESTCWRYDLDRYRYVLHGSNMAFQAAAALGFGLVLGLLNRRSWRQRSGDPLRRSSATALNNGSAGSSQRRASNSLQLQQQTPIPQPILTQQLAEYPIEETADITVASVPIGETMTSAQRSDDVTEQSGDVTECRTSFIDGVVQLSSATGRMNYGFDENSKNDLSISASATSLVAPSNRASMTSDRFYGDMKSHSEESSANGELSSNDFRMSTPSININTASTEQLLEHNDVMEEVTVL